MPTARRADSYPKLNFAGHVTVTANDASPSASTDGSLPSGDSEPIIACCICFIQKKMHHLLRKTLAEIACAPPRVNLAFVASSNRRVFHVDHCLSNASSSKHDNAEDLVGFSRDGVNPSSPLDPPAAAPTTANAPNTPTENTYNQDANPDKQPASPRRARLPPLRKRVIYVDNVVDGASLRKLKDLLSHEFGDISWLSIGRFARDEPPDNVDHRPDLRQAYVLFKHPSSVDKVRARLGSLIDFDGTALRAELIPPVAVGGPSNRELRERLYPRKESLHPAGVRPKDTLFVRRLENADVEELRKHIDASFSDLVSLTRLGSCLELRFTDVKAASRARTALKDHFRRSNSTSWVDFRTDEGDLPVVLRAQKRNRAEQLLRLQRALADPARSDKESLQVAIEAAQQKLTEVKEKLAHVEGLAANPQ